MDIDALAALAGNTIVAAAVTDAFEGMRAAVARIFGRDGPDPVIERRLDETRQQLAIATQGELESAHATQARRWENRFMDFLADHPEAAGELRALVEKFRTALPDAGGNVTNTISGTVRGGPVLMGRDFGDITIGRHDDPPGGG
jgi:CTP:molybdopterin cytidylyltransferase MocA